MPPQLALERPIARMRARDLDDDPPLGRIVESGDKRRQVGNVVEDMPAHHDGPPPCLHADIRPAPENRPIGRTLLEHVGLTIDGNDARRRRTKWQRHRASAGADIQDVSARGKRLEGPAVRRGERGLRSGLEECDWKRPGILGSLSLDALGDGPGVQRLTPSAPGRRLVLGMLFHEPGHRLSGPPPWSF